MLVKKAKKGKWYLSSEISNSGLIPRMAAWDVLQSVASGAYADIALDRALSKYSMSEIDKGLFTELSYGAIRQRYYLDCWINYLADLSADRQPPLLRWLLHVGLYQIFKMARIPDSAAVNTTVELSKKNNMTNLSPVVNALLRKALRLRDAGEGLPLPKDTCTRLAQNYSLPFWLATELIALRGEESAESVASAFNRTPFCDLRVNGIKTSLSNLKQLFIAKGIEANPINGLHNGLVIKSGLGDIRHWPGFEGGLWSVQDRSSQWVSTLLEVESGNRILDACAAPGGKATHLAELISDRGEIWAVDRSAKRLKKVAENASRLGLTSLNFLAHDASKLLEIKPQWSGYFQKILIDAPCSGLGTLARHPDARWRMSLRKINDLVVLQKQLLEGILPLLSRGGRIVYSTCTFHPEENQYQIDRFLKLYPELTLVFQKQIWPGEDILGDGFYAAVLDKN